MYPPHTLSGEKVDVFLEAAETRGPSYQAVEDFFEYWIFRGFRG